MFKPAKYDQLDMLVAACDKDIETTLFDSIIYGYIKKQKLKLFYVAECCVGFIIEELIDPEAELIQLFIFQEYRGQGYGKLCMLQWHDSLVERSVCRSFLEVRHGNKPAIKLYQSLDYINVGRRKNYYQLDSGTYDALLMDKLI